MFIVYVLESNSGNRYTGHTENIEKRLFEHNNGMCKTTKADRNWQLVYSERYPTRSEAMKREKWLKTGAGRVYLDTTLTRDGVRHRRSSSSGS